MFYCCYFKQKAKTEKRVQHRNLLVVTTVFVLESHIMGTFFVSGENWSVN